MNRESDEDRPVDQGSFASVGSVQSVDQVFLCGKTEGVGPSTQGAGLVSDVCGGQVGEGNVEWRIQNSE